MKLNRRSMMAGMAAAGAGLGTGVAFGAEPHQTHLRPGMAGSGRFLDPLGARQQEGFLCRGRHRA